MTSSDLAGALAAVRPTLEKELAKARAELAELDARRADLLRLIQQTESVLGIDPSTAPAPAFTSGARGRTLHEVIADVLRENENRGMTAAELARQINERDLYRQRDGGAVPANQIHARTKNYAHLFEKDGSMIRLKS